MLVNLVSFSIQMAKTFATVPNCLRLSQSYLSLYPPRILSSPFYYFLSLLFAQQIQKVFYKTSVKKNAVSQFAPFPENHRACRRRKFLWQKKIRRKSTIASAADIKHIKMPESVFLVIKTHFTQLQFCINIIFNFSLNDCR